MPATLDPPPRTCRERLAHAARLGHRHPCLSLIWSSSFTMLVVGTATGNAHLGRWGLWVTAPAAVASLYAVARWMIGRITHIYDALHYDVPLADGPPHGAARTGTGGAHVFPIQRRRPVSFLRRFGL